MFGRVVRLFNVEVVLLNFATGSSISQVNVAQL